MIYKYPYRDNNGHFDSDGARLRNLGNPVEAQDAITKDYFDTNAVTGPIGPQGIQGDAGPVGPAGSNGTGVDTILDFSGHSMSYLETGSTVYIILTEFIFQGTDVLGTLSEIFLLIGSDDAVDGASFKIYDKTNALSIAEVSVISLERIITNVGILSNIPTGPVIWEIQCKRNASGAKAQLSAMRMVS